MAAVDIQLAAKANELVHAVVHAARTPQPCSTGAFESRQSLHPRINDSTHLVAADYLPWKNSLACKYWPQTKLEPSPSTGESWMLGAALMCQEWCILGGYHALLV